MRYASLVVLLAIAPAACGEEGGIAVDELRVVKVSGDQSAPVRDPEASTIGITLGVDGWTDSALIARVEDAGEGSGTVSGVGSATARAAAPVHWQLPDVAGRLFGRITETDDSGYSINRWAPGTRAGRYYALAGRRVDGDIVWDEDWTLVVEPGAVANVRVHEPADYPYSIQPGQKLDLRPLVRSATDAYGNSIPVDEVYELPESDVGYAWCDLAADAKVDPCRPGPDAAEANGWEAIVPDFEARGYAGREETRHVPERTVTVYQPGLYVWFVERRNDLPVAFQSVYD